MSRTFKWCSDKQSCRRVSRGDCDGHPDCQNKLKCQYLQTRSCNYYHPPYHFALTPSVIRSPRAQTKSPNSQPRHRDQSPHRHGHTHTHRNRSRKHVRHRSEDRDMSVPIEFTKPKESDTHKPWTESEENTLISFAQSFGNGNGIPIEKMSELKNKLQRDLMDIKICLFRMKKEGKLNKCIESEKTELEMDTKPWMEWELNYLISFVEKHKISQSFTREQSTQIETALNRQICDINLRLKLLREDGTVRDHSNSPLFPYIHSSNNDSVKTENMNGNTTEILNGNMELECNGNLSENECTISDLSETSNVKPNVNVRKRKFCEMSAELSESNVNMKSDRNLEINALELTLKHELRKGESLLSNMRVSENENDQRKYKDLLNKYIESMKKCNDEMDTHQNTNKRAKYGDLVRARNGRGHIRKKHENFM